MNNSLHHEIHRITDTEEHARDFLFQRGILKTSMSCPSCTSDMNLVPCSSSKSSDLLIWRCTPCKRFKNVRADSVLSGQKLTFSVFLQLVFYLSVKSLTNVSISQLTGVSENTISICDWKAVLHTRVADFLVANPSPIGGPGVIVEMDEAKFGKRKYNKRASLSADTPVRGHVGLLGDCPRISLWSWSNGYFNHGKFGFWHWSWSKFLTI